MRARQSRGDPLLPAGRGAAHRQVPPEHRVPKGSRFDKSEYFAATATEEALARVEDLLSLASKLDRQLSELAVAWLDAKPQVASVLIGSSTPAQVARNVSHLRRPLDEDELAMIDDFLEGR